MERQESRSASFYEKEAKLIVGQILDQSVNLITPPPNDSAEGNITPPHPSTGGAPIKVSPDYPAIPNGNVSENGIHNDESDGQSELTVKTRNIDWGSIGEFTIEYGEEKINEYIRTCWDIHKCWLFCIDYLSVQEHDFDIRHVYRVRWSAPTRRKPIPRATACVYFTISLHKFKPQSSPLDVYFVIESNRFVHRPGAARFREKWLSDVIESKVQLMNTISF